MIKVHVAADGTNRSRFTGARGPRKSIKVYVGSFASRREAEFAAQAAPRHPARDQGGRAPRRRGPQAHHGRRARRVAQGNQGPALARRVREPHAALRAPDVRQHPAREDHEAQADRAPHLAQGARRAAQQRRRSTRFSPRSPRPSATSSSRDGAPRTRSSSSADLEVAERPFLWLQSAGEVQKLLAACNENIRTLVAVLVEPACASTRRCT